jgi:hypothetical protein
LHHAAKDYIPTERLGQVERLVEGAGSRAAHYVPQIVAGVVGSYWFGSGRAPPIDSPADTATTSEHEKKVNAPISSGTRRIKQCTNFPLALVSSLVVTPAAFACSLSSRSVDVRLRVFAALTVIYSLLAIATPTSAFVPVDVESEVDDDDFVVVITPDSSGSKLAPAHVVSQDRPNDVVTSPLGQAPQDEPEPEDEAADVLTLTTSESVQEYESPAVVVHPSLAHVYVPPPSPQEAPESEPTAPSHVPESAHNSASPADESQAAPVAVAHPPPARAAIPDPKRDSVLHTRTPPHDDNLVAVAHVLAPVPESIHESSPVVVSAQLPEPASTSVMFHEETTSVGAISDPAATTLTFQCLPQMPHNEDTHGADHDATVSLPEDGIGAVAERAAGSAVSAPGLQEAEEKVKPDEVRVLSVLPAHR